VTGMMQPLTLAVFVLLVVGIISAHSDPQLVQEKLSLDNFEADQIGPWWTSKNRYVSHFMEKGTNQKDLQLITDEERTGQVLVAQVTLASGENNRFFLMRSVSVPKSTVAYGAVTFWYRTRGTIPDDTTLYCRLRRDPDAWGTKFMDLPFEADTQGQWRQVELPIVAAQPRNVWPFYMLPLIQAGFQITTGQQALEMELAIDDLELIEKPTLPASYKPRQLSVPPREGPMRLLLCKHSCAGHYGIRQAAVELPETGTVDVVRFRGLHLGLEEFPQSRQELAEYDAVALVDVDALALSPEQLAMIVDYVASGGGLLVAGGPNSFGNSASFPPVLDAILPVARDDEGRLEDVNRSVTIAGAHPITAGLPANLGEVGQAHSLSTKPDAATVLAADRPVMVAGDYQKGRIVVLNAFPGKSPPGSSIFRNDFYDDLLRQTLHWLAQREPAASFAEFAAPPSELAAGEALFLRFETSGATVAARIRIRHGEGELVLDPIHGGPLFLGSNPLPQSPLSRTPFDINVELLDSKEKVVARRDFKVIVSKPVRLELRLAAHQSQVTEPGKPFRCVVSGDTACADEEFTVAIYEGDRPVFSLPRKTLEASDDGQAQVEMEFAVPELEEGDYSLRVTAQIADEEIAAELPIYVAAPMQWGDFFPVMGVDGIEGDKHQMDEFGEVARARELYEHGFTTVAAGPFDFNREALRLGMALFNDYTHYIKWQAWEPTDPGVFAPDYYASVQEHQRNKVAKALPLPCYFSAKIIDEPTSTPFMLAYDDDDRRAYREMFGEEMPDWIPEYPTAKKLPSGDENAVARRKWAQFLSYYAERAYEATLRAKNEAGADYNLILTFGPGTHSWAPARQYFADVLNWCRHCDMMDYDRYPYFYADSFANSPQIRMAGTHFDSSYFRTAANYLDKPCGFYVEVDDRNWPYQKTPYNASSELAYTALAQGGDYINTFITVAFGEGHGARLERWEDWGQQMREIRSLAPLLANSRRPTAPVGLIQPYTTQYMAEATDIRPWYSFEHICRACGDADVVDERILRDRGISPYESLILLGARWMDSNMAPQLVEFVENGGLLIYDELPEFDENMNELTWPEKMADGQEHSWGEGMPIERCPYGEGECVRLKFDPEQWCRTATEEDQPAKATAFQRGFRELIFAHGIRPHARSSNPDVEVALREAEGSSVLIAISHAEQTEDTTVTLNNIGHPVEFVSNMTTGEPIEYQQDGDSLTIQLQLDSRCGRIIGLYPQRPADLAVEASRKQFAPGQPLKYRLSVLDDKEQLAQGSHVVRVTFTDPAGQRRARYSSPALCTGGSTIITANLAENAPVGTWTITAEDWLGNQSPTVEFDVR